MISVWMLDPRKYAYLVLLLLSTAGFPGCQKAPTAIVAHAPFAADSGSLAIRCGHLIDGLGNEAMPDRLVIVRDGRVAEVAAGDSRPPDDIALLDLSEYTCLPGLIDAHVHLDIYPEDSDDYTVYLRRTPDDTRAIALDNARIALDAGFTTVRHVGSYLAWVDRDTKAQIDAGLAVGPRIQTAGFYLTKPHGGGDMYIPGVADEDIPDYYRMGVSSSTEEYRQKAEQLVAGGAEVLKIIASGAVFGFGGVVTEPEMTPEDIAAVVDVAHGAGLKVTAHAHGARSVREAILAGVDSIEHASLADDAGIALAAERNVVFTMDVYNGTYTAEVGPERGWPEEFLRKNDETTEAQRIVFEKAHAAGVAIAFGSDAGVAPHGKQARQFSFMVERSMSPMDAIKAASSVAAELMAWQKDVGALTGGRYGDLIAVRGDPLQDISILENVDVVVKGGLIFKLPQ